MTVPVYSTTMSPASIGRLAYRPSPCMRDLGERERGEGVGRWKETDGEMS